MLESNRVAGKAVRWLARMSNAVYTPGHVEGLPESRVKPMGIPIRQELRIEKSDKGIVRERTTILVMGGSQGAKCINQAVCDTLPHLKEFSSQIQFIHLCGTSAEEIDATYRKHGIQARVMAFHHKMEELYGECDLVVCRSGGSTLAELTAIGLASILIPFEKAADGHQYKNALAMESAGACKLLQERELTGESLGKTILSCLRNAEEIRHISQNARAIGKPNAAEDIARDLLNLIKTKRCQPVASR